MNRARHIIHLLNEILFEAGESPGRMELVHTSLATAREFAEKAFKDNGKDLDKEIPNFDRNYQLAQRIAGTGWMARRDMPVIEIEQVKVFQNRLEQGYIDINAPLAPATIATGSPFPEGLSNEKAKEWLENGLKDNSIPDDQVRVESLWAQAEDLKPIQKQIYFDKAIEATAKFGVEGTKSFIQNQSLTVASADYYIIDGHHRWLSSLLINPGMTIKGVKISLPIDKLLPLAKSYSDAVGNPRNA